MKDENGLRQIHLAGDLLHLSVVQALSLRKDRQRVAAESTVEENVKLNEVIRAQSGSSNFQIDLFENDRLRDDVGQASAAHIQTHQSLCRFPPTNSSHLY